MKLKDKNIFIYMQGGLGNQLFIYYAGKFLETKYNKKVVFISGSRSKISEVGIVFENLQIILPKSVFLALGKVCKKLSTIRLFKKYIYFSDEIGYENIKDKISKIRLYNSYFQSYYYFENSSISKFTENQKLLRFTPRISPSLKIATQNSIGVHIRRGDYLLPKNHYFGVLSVDYYFNALNKLMSSGNYESIYLFSDSKIDKKFIATIQSGFKDKNIVDMAQSKSMSDTEVFVCLTLFPACVISNSTFSWWGAYLGTNEKTVIAPDKWFKSRTDPALIYPTHWKTSTSYWE